MISKGCNYWILSAVIPSILLFLLFTYVSSIFVYFFVPFICISVFFLIFFRDPKRKIGSGFISPADGKIRDIKIDEKTCFISIFMNVYNVHVNRIPIKGTILDISHYPGKNFGAWKKEAEENEKVKILIDSDIGKVTVVQIAGLIARRIYPYIKKGDRLKKGDKIGIIRLGSRVDVYLPANKVKKIKVEIGDKVKAGKSTLVDLK